MNHHSPPSVPPSAQPALIDHFNETAKIYDERNRRLGPIVENLHFLIRLILKDSPARARVLCVGVGTGTEILQLANTFPDWTFVGVDLLPGDGEPFTTSGNLDRRRNQL